MSTNVILLIILLSIISPCPVATSSYAAQKPKQVILVSLDTTRADHLGCYGSKVVKTPNLDTFAKDAVLFQRCYSPSNFTNPSHASIFTSLYMKDHGITANRQALPDEPRMLAKQYKEAGYKTAGFISVNHLGKLYNFNQGFDEFYDLPSSHYKATRSSEETNKNILPWIEQHKRDNFFIFVHYYDTHTPYTPPPPFNTMYNFKSGERLSDPRIKSSIEKLSPQLFEELTASDDPEYYRNLYKGEVSYQDQSIGRLFQQLKDAGIYDDATIIVVADHGESLGENDVFFGHLYTLHDNTIQVPLLIKPGKTGKTGTRAQMVSSVDIYPTLLDLSDIPLKYQIRGKSLIGIINNADNDELRTEVYSEGGGKSGISIRTPQHTYIWDIKDETGVFDDVEKHRQLYNNSGKEESASLARQQISEFNNNATKYFNDLISTEKPKIINDKNTLKKLKSLGYTH